jgi:hypothetical protein
MATILVFLATGLVLLLTTVPERLPGAPAQ